MPLKGITAQLIFNLCYAITLLQQQPAPFRYKLNNQTLDFLV